MRIRMKVQLESLSGVHACEFGVLPLRCINESRSYTRADIVSTCTHVYIKIPSRVNIRQVLVEEPRRPYQGLYCQKMV